MTAPKTRAELGRSNNSKGKRWMADVRDWLHEVFPGAEVIASNSRGRPDLAGLTDWTVECKDTATDENLGQFLTAVQGVQQVRGTPYHVILKKRRFKPTGQGYAIMTLDQWRDIARQLDQEGQPR